MPPIGPPESQESPLGLPTINVGMAFGPRRSAHEEVLAKLSREQIGRLVEQGDREIANRHEERMETIRTARRVAYALLVAGFATSVAFLAFGKPELLKEIIVFVVGAGSGYGVGRVTATRSESGRES